MRKIHHHVYHLAGITDFAKQKADAERNRDKKNETTILHDHAHITPGSTRHPCTDQCRIYIPGEEPRAVTHSEARS